TDSHRSAQRFFLIVARFDVLNGSDLFRDGRLSERGVPKLRTETVPAGVAVATHAEEMTARPALQNKRTAEVCLMQWVTVVAPRSHAILQNKAKYGDIAKACHRTADKLDFFGNKASEQFSRCLNALSGKLTKRVR